MIIGLTSSSSQIIHHPLPTDDPRPRRPDISKAQELLEWQPKTPLLDGLMKTIDYFEQFLCDQRTHAQHLAR
jgi:UDP-glucuronate decarboxylase